MSRDRLADAVVRLDAVRVADSSGAVGSQRARCSRAVVEALRAPLGAPVRVTLRESDGEDIGLSEGILLNLLLVSSVVLCSLQTILFRRIRAIIPLGPIRKGFVTLCVFV